uniref:Vps72/YL1 C-terminal domain-containing protein n=1 Tax=Strigamia maritima TaxID=126957 RepID=T1JEQ4_STRMM
MVAKRKRPLTPSNAESEGSTVAGSGVPSPTPSDTGDKEEKKDKIPVFKDPNFVHSNKSGQAASKKTRVWKNLKQIIAAERLLQWTSEDITYVNLEAPPSFKPAKKYSDISGLLANYTDPQTKIRYATTDEFSKLRLLPIDLATGYLALRKANTPVP